MKILVVRRDNIGDLVVTTPVFTALRQRFPAARIEALVNSYNGAVLAGHPDVDEVHVYTKSKHEITGRSQASQWSQRVRQVLQLRARRYDYVIVASPGFHRRQVRLARWLQPAHIVAFCPGARCAGVDMAVESADAKELHHVERTFRILQPFGIAGPIPAMRIHPPAVADKLHRALRIGMHISARKAFNRWPAARFGEWARRVSQETGAQIRMLWSPGDECDRRHPGDDGKAREIVAAARAASIESCETRRLQDLVQALAGCDLVFCSDGGALHLAAALGKPIVCMFGDSPAQEWRPWGVPYRLLQPTSREVSDITVEEALGAFRDLAAEVGLVDRDSRPSAAD